MRKVRLIIWLVSCLSCFSLYAKPIDRIILKNGSVLDGFISSQRLGKDFVFTSDSAIIYLPSKEVKSMEDTACDLKDLSLAWRNWAKANGAMQREEGRNLLKLTHILRTTASGETQEIDNVRVLEKGVTIKYLDLSPGTCILNWDMVRVIERDKRDKTTLSGLNDIVQLKASREELEGQIVEQEPGKLIRLLKADGMIEVIGQDQILKQKKKKANPDQSLFEQSPLIDIVQTKDGSSVKGIIVEQSFGRDKEPSYLLIQSSSGKTVKMEHRNIREMQREKNTEYKVKTDVLLKRGEVLINRNSTEDALVEETDDLVTILPESIPVVLTLDSMQQQLIVESNFGNENEAEDLVLLQIGPKAINKKESRNGFTYKELVTNGVRYMSKETSVNGTTRLIYLLDAPGDYIIYGSVDKRVILCQVE